MQRSVSPQTKVKQSWNADNKISRRFMSPLELKWANLFILVVFECLKDPKEEREEAKQVKYVLFAVSHQCPSFIQQQAVDDVRPPGCLLAFGLRLILSGINTSVSEVSCSRARRAASVNVTSTLLPSFALVSKNGRAFAPFDLHQLVARFTATFLSACLSHLLPTTMKGKLSGSLGAACTKNSSRHVSKLSKDFGFVISYTKMHASAPL
mmetsp:Transcript_4362/g.6017  ORF Transcript_4362/g.6017 Transcript_4362/m.6017 type:complete len:209 (-) Transcript_4362:317-943(-)